MPDFATDTISLPDHPAVPGLVFRHFRGERDYPGLMNAANAARAVDTQDWVMTLDDVAREYDHLVNSDPARDMIVAEVDGEIVGFTRGEWFVELSGVYRAWFLLTLAPAWRGHGIRRAMLHWVEARMRQVAADHPDHAERDFMTWVPPKGSDVAALLEEEGYKPVRHFFRMTRSLDEPIPDFPMPAGLEMRPVLPDHYRAIWDASQEAFRDHWGFVEVPDTYFEEWQADKTIFTPELWQIAWDVETNEIAGQVRTFVDKLENETFGRQRGYTEFISVRRPYRRRGLARALIAASLRLQKSLGLTESALVVDADSPTGAGRVYSDCGFKVVSRSANYGKPIAGN